MFGNKSKDADYEYFTIYDSKTQSYRMPMPAINAHDMLRQIDGLFRDPQQAQNQLITNAEDFSLFKCGEYTQKTGELVGTKLEHIANLHDIRASIQAKQKPGLSALN